MPHLGDLGPGVRVASRRLLLAAAEALMVAGFDSRQPTVLLDVPLHSNVGDSLITLGELRLIRLLKGSAASIPLRHVSSREDDVDATISRIPDGANVLFQGGGNFGDMWPKSHMYRLEVTRKLSYRTNIIWLPQSIWFQDPHGRIAQDTHRVLRDHKPAVLLRDHASLKRFRQLFDQIPILCPDLGLCADVQPSTRLRSDVECHLMRRDIEATTCRSKPEENGFGVDWNDSPRSKGIRSVLDRIARRIIRLSPLAPARHPFLEFWAFTHLAQSRVQRGIALFGSAEVIHTSRLHAAILALLTGRGVRLEDNSYGKVSGVFETWSEYIQ